MNENKEKINKKLVSTKPISLLFTIVSNKKLDYYVDLIQNFQVNMQMSIVANGTTKSAIFVDDIGTKAVIISFILNENIDKTLKTLEEKFAEINDGKGVAYVIPLSSVMGVSLYNFLSNNKSSLV